MGRNKIDNEDIASKINNILGDKSNLKDVMSFIALYICVYEKFAKINLERIKELLSTFEIKNGELKAVVSDKYNELKNIFILEI